MHEDIFTDFESPANPEPGTSIGQLLVRAPFVDLQAQDSLVERKRALQVFNQEPNMMHSLVLHPLCTGRSEHSPHAPCFSGSSVTV